MRETFTSGSVGRAPGNRCSYPELGHAMRIQVAQSSGRQAEEFYLGAVQPDSRPRKDSPPPYHRSQTSESGCLMASLCTAEASTTEEPDAGKLHVRVCTGGAG